MLFKIDGTDLWDGENGPDSGPFSITWTKTHRIQVKEIPYFRDKTIVTSGKGDPNGAASGVLWELMFQAKSIAYKRFLFYKAVSETAGPHTIVSSFGEYSMYLKKATFVVGSGEREPFSENSSGEGMDQHFIGESTVDVNEYIGTWTFEFVEVNH